MKYFLMHKSKEVLLMDVDEDTGTIIGLHDVFLPEHFPVGVRLVKDVPDRAALNGWWTGRCIPASRSGLREALEAMQIPSPQLLLTRCYGLSLSDQYWVRPENLDLQWKDINFFDNRFLEDVGNILFGKIPESSELDLMSPDNTSDGWLRKKWKIIDGKRCLIKGGSGATRQEPYNEVLASAVMRRLSIPHIPYTLLIQDGYPYSVCEDFITADTELISAWYIMQTKKKPNHISGYQHYLDCCRSFGLEISGMIDRMLVLDYIIANEDRHLNNFGLVRNADTLEWIGAAPIYDCGTSMWFNQPNTLIKPSDKRLQSKPFKPVHDEQIKLVQDFSWLDFLALKGIDEEFSNILKGSIFIDDVRRDLLCYALKKRVESLQDYVLERV